MKGFIIQRTYRIIDQKPVICLFGKLENNQSFLAAIHTKPYFFIKNSDTKKAKSFKDVPEFKIKPAALKDFTGKKVSKVILETPKDVPELRKAFESNNIKCYEADIRFAYRYLFDKDIKNSISIEGDYESSEFVADSGFLLVGKPRPLR